MRVALGFANRAELALSNLGFRITEALLAARPGVRLERLFLPAGRAPLAGARIRTTPSGLKLPSLDLLLWSLSFEGDAPHLPALMAAGGLPALAEERDEGHPLVVAGGAAVMINPEPLAAFCDLFLVGEAEALLEAFLDRWQALRGERRAAAIAALAELPGAVAPLLRRHRVWALPEGGDRGRGGSPDAAGAPRPAGSGAAGTGIGFSLRGGDEVSLRRGPGRFDPWPEAAAGSAVETVKWTQAAGEVSRARLAADGAFPGALLLELGRGCPRRCRFCAATRIYAPLRRRPAGLVARVAREESLPGETVGLLSLSAGDHPGLGALTQELCAAGRRVSISSLPATFDDEAALRALLDSGTTTLTIAPETGSDRLRALAGKPMENEAILRGVERLGMAGLAQLRAYFMIGLPFEEEEDLRALTLLLARMRALLPASTRLSATVNAFSPKPRTPFQWAGMAPAHYLEDASRRLLKDAPRGVTVRVKSPREARRHALLARGDVRWGARLAAMAGEWRAVARVLRAEGLRAEALTGAADPGTPLPWGYLVSPREAILLREEWERARAEAGRGEPGTPGGRASP
ncbi:MAG: radical SAM protein [Candidatus Eisenbacteria bacterium]|uniref:Radical SAM protein n=1 Tax=Eiseniibacteriota bacterium TaxID=2212470 RepID=A0A937XBL4_UNCEI|nr:radical SAM protein [Candidatus Eisenbacteria bacterium]